MNAQALAQSEFDNRQPPPVSETPEENARAEWLYNAIEQLVEHECDVSFQRRMRKPQGLTVVQLALAVDEHVNGRLAGCQINTPALGHLLISAKRGHPDKTAADELLGRSEHPLGMLGEISEKLLKPLVDDALIAQAEDDEL